MRVRLAAGLLLALVALGGCGGDGGQQAGPLLPRSLAEELAQRSTAVAAKLEAGDSCGAQDDAEALQQETVGAINDGRVPARFQEELTAAVGALVASIECPDSPPPATQPDQEEAREEEEDEEKDEGEKGGDDGSGGGKDSGEGEGKGKDEDDGEGEKGKG